MSNSKNIDLLQGDIVHGDKNVSSQRAVVKAESGSSATIIQFPTTVNITNAQKHTILIKAEVQPNQSHISDLQAATLKRLVNEITELENGIKKQPSSHAKVWASLNRHCKVPRYRLIPLEAYPKAEKFLRTWIGRINSHASMPRKKPEDWRNRQYSFIYTNLKTEDDQAWKQKYLADKFNVTSLTELSNEDLKKFYNVVQRRKAKNLKAQLMLPNN